MCRNKGCLNPYHLEAVPPTVNRQRNRIGEPHPLTSWMLPSPDVATPHVSDTGCIEGWVA